MHHSHVKVYFNFYIDLKLEFTCPIKNIKESTKEDFNNKTQLSQKKLQRYHVSLATPTKDLPPKTPTAAHLLPRMKARDHHRHQSHGTKCKGSLL